MQFYFNPMSAPCRAVLLFLHALNIQPEMLQMEPAELRTETYLKLNPQHTVPLIVDDDFVLSESRAILGYLADKYAPQTTYYPNDPKARAIVNQRLMFDLDGPYKRLLNTYVEPLIKGQTKRDEYEAAKMMESVGFLEAFMGDAEYLAGNKITIADYAMVVTISLVEGLGHDLTPYPKVSRWLKKCKSEMKDYDELEKMQMVPFLQNFQGLA